LLLEYIEIGEIVNTYGVKGELKVLPLTDNPERYYDLKWVYIGDDSSVNKYNIEKLRILKNAIILKVKEINNLNQAKLLKGLFVIVDRDNAVKLPDDTYFICDLIGCSVYEEVNGRQLGILENIIKTSSNDIYIIKSQNGKEILIPALKSVVKRISVKEKKIWVLLPDGLIDDDF